MERRRIKSWLPIRFVGVRTAWVLAAGASIAVFPVLLRSSPLKMAFDVPLSRKCAAEASTRRSWKAEKTCAALLHESRDIPAPQLSISACVHLLRLHGPQAEAQINGETVRVLSLLTDANAGIHFFGQPAFVPTASGIRFPVITMNGTLSGPFDDSHRDLCLACFAELGLPIDFPLVTRSGESIELRLAVSDSIATFHLTQQELEWTTIAFAHYISDTSWTNRFAEITTFDEVTKELLRRKLRDSSCGGAHRLLALSQLLFADSQRKILSAAVRRETLDYLHKVLTILRQTQSPGGFWTPDWCLLVDAAGSKHITAETLDTRSSRLLVTGHLAEWFRVLPAGLEDRTTMVPRSHTWLRSQTQFTESTRFWDNCCPWTHVLCALSD